MKLLFLTLVLAALSACSSHISLSPIDSERATAKSNCDPIHNSYRTAIVKLDTLKGSTASGVVISKNRIITVAHAIEPKTKIYAEIDQVLHEAKVISIDRNTDLAYLAVETKNIQPLPLTTRLPLPGESVWATGFPLAAKQRVSTGFFEELSGGRLYPTVHINSGTSGGGLLRCEDGIAKLAGVIHGYVALNKGGNLINIGDSTSVPAAEIVNFIDEPAAKLIVNASPNNQFSRTRGAL